MKYTSMSDLESYIQDFLEKFPTTDEYVAYGAGSSFLAMREFFGALLKIRYCVDMDASKKVAGLAVYPPESLKNKRHKIIITTNGGYADEIAHHLESMGYDRSEYCHAHELLSIWGRRYKKKNSALFCGLLLGFACNLRCKGCSEYADYVQCKDILDFETLKSTVDAYFQIVDYVVQISVLGGEAFLSRETGRICRYIHEMYPNKFYKLVIQTNGTVVPRDDVFEDLSHCEKLQIWISNYEKYLNKTQLKNSSRFKGKVDSYGIRHNNFDTFNQEEQKGIWFDLGDPRIKKNDNEQMLRERFSKCSALCFNLYKDKYYYCFMQASAAETGLYTKSQPKDYLILSELVKQPAEKRSDAFLNFQLGFFKEGYLSFCDYCNGMGIGANQSYIIAGEQIKDGIRA